MILKTVYALFIGILLAAFVGFGIDAFYPAPPAPQPPIELRSPSSGSNTGQVQQFQKQQDAYQKKLDNYNKTLSIILLASAVIILIVSLSVMQRLDVMADGFLMGGVFTLLYGIARGISAQDTKFRFLLITMSFLIALSVGYFHFLRPQKK